MADAPLLHAWRNDPQTRRASRRSDVVPWAEHEAWLVHVIASLDRVIRVAEEDGRAVGVVRADRSATGCELSWTVAPEARGRGIGQRMLKKFAASLDGRLIAVIRKDSAGSAKIATAVGLRRVGPAEDPNFDLWARE
jgi:RimJ/RimL family protein N-acetyltransferase